MNKIVDLQIAGVNYRDYDTIDLIGDNITDLHVSVRNGIIVGHLQIPGVNIVNEVLRASVALSAICESASFVRVFMDPVGVADISKRSRVSRQAVQKWTEKVTFPTPVGSVAANCQKIWAWNEVCDWIEENKDSNLAPERLSSIERNKIDIALSRSHRDNQSASTEREATMGRVLALNTAWVRKNVFEFTYFPTHENRTGSSRVNVFTTSLVPDTPESICNSVNQSNPYKGYVG